MIKIKNNTSVIAVVMAATFLMSGFFAPNYTKAATLGDVVVNEFLADPFAVSDANGEWIELKNVSGVAVDLLNWKISNGTPHTFSSNVVIAPNRSAVICADNIVVTNGGVKCDYLWAGMALVNAGDTITLKDASDTVIDSVTYTGTDVVAGKSTNVVAGPTGPIFSTELTNQFGAGDFGTPAGNTVSILNHSYPTIQSAINTANNDDVINVYPGTYDQDEANGLDPVTGLSGSSDFNIFINKSVTIQGVDLSGNPITDASNVAAFVVPKRDTPLGNLSTIFVQADGVTISGLDVTAYADQDFNYKTISVIGDNVTIKNSALHAGDQVSSIYVYDPRYDEVTNTSHLQSYRFEGNSLDAEGIDASGIRISSGPG